jgi:peptidylprolyl isomerase
MADKKEAAKDVAADGMTVKVHYKGSLENGEVFDTSEGKDPIQFELGAKAVVPGFENAIRGMKVGEKKSVTLSKDEAYGDTRPELVQDVPMEQVKQAGIEPKQGMVLGLTHPQNPQMQMPAKVVEVGKDTVKLDMNHPLAGKTLKFDLELVAAE